MNVTQLADALKISRTQTRRYRERGMPMTSERSARAWLKKFSKGSFADGGATDGGTSDGTKAAEGSTSDDLEGLSQAELTRKLMAARIRLTGKDTALKALQEKQAQMDADLRAGKLLRAEEVQKKNHEVALALRNKLMELPSQWALHLAATTDPALVADYTRKRIKAALVEFCVGIGVLSEEDARANYSNLNLSL